MNVNLQVLIGECRSRHLSVDDVMGALAASMVETATTGELPAQLLGADPAPLAPAAPAKPSAARAAPPVAPPPPTVPAAPAALATRHAGAVALGSAYADAHGFNWRDSAGTWFDPAAHAWNRAGHPAVTPAGKFRAKRAGSMASPPAAGAETKAAAAETDGQAEQLPPGDQADLQAQLEECAAVHGLNELELFVTHFETLFVDWQEGTPAERAAYREVEIAIDAKREELTERLSPSDGDGQGQQEM